MQGKIVKVSGPLIVAENMAECRMYDVVRVSDKGLIGEVIELRGDRASIQVYEETSGLGTGEVVESTGMPLSVELAPGLIGGIFDGIQRPLTRIAELYGDRITRGISVTNLDHEKEWEFIPLVKAGDKVSAGDFLGYVQETPIVSHKILVPQGADGTVTAIERGMFNITQTVAKIATRTGEREVSMLTRWPVRRGRPYREKMSPTMPMITGQRVIDTLFPIARGGVAAVPGPFGSGKTVVQHQLAKWADADIIVYIGCGERGNEMTQALEEFSELKDPRNGLPLMNRTILIANTSNMPVAAREASVYTGMTIAEYYRDMGYHVALMADSTPRWAEALREISGRLEEMPAEEGFPAYLASRLAEFYERAGYVKTLEGKEGSVTVIGAVSPQGGDFSEPVTQNTKRYVRTFWGLDRALAYARHFPSINWLTSYSEYADDLKPWYDEHVGPEFVNSRHQIAHLLQKESELMEIVKLIGADILPEDQKLVMETARLIRVGFLQQNAYHAIDTYVPLDKQLRMMELMLKLYHGARDIVSRAIPLSQLKATGIFESLAKMKYEVPNDHQEKFDEYDKAIDEALRQVNEANR